MPSKSFANDDTPVIVYYIVYIFQMADLEGDTNLLASSIQYVLFIIFTGIM